MFYTKDDGTATGLTIHLTQRSFNGTHFQQTDIFNMGKTDMNEFECFKSGREKEKEENEEMQNHAILSAKLLNFPVRLFC